MTDLPKEEEVHEVQELASVELPEEQDNVENTPESAEEQVTGEHASLYANK